MKDFSAFQKWAAERLAFFRSNLYAVGLSYQLGEFEDSDLIYQAKRMLRLNDCPESMAKRIVSDYKSALAEGFPEGGDWKLRVHRGNFYVGDEAIDSALSDSTCESFHQTEFGIETDEDKAACEAMFPGELHFIGDNEDLQVEFYFPPIGVVVDVPEKYFIAQP